MNQIQSMYLELLKKTLIDLHRSALTEYRPARGRKVATLTQPGLAIIKLLEKRDLIVCEKVKFSVDDRMNGKDWPLYAESMIGYKRLSNVQQCVIDVIEKNIPGDLIETGVWRGGMGHGPVGSGHRKLATNSGRGPGAAGLSDSCRCAGQLKKDSVLLRSG